MPVLINNETRLAEDLAEEQAHAAARGGSHSIPMFDQEGQMMEVPAADYHAAVGQGLQPANEEQLGHLLKYAKHATTSEQAKTFAEGAAKAATFGLSTGVERLAGAKPEDIQGREEINPGLSIAGESVGLGASALLPGHGALGVLQHAGESVAAHVATSKLGQQVAKQATEMALLSSGDEVSKKFAGDPDQTMQSVIGHIGLSTALGAGFGAATDKIIEPVWKATKGANLTRFLGVLRDKAQGVGGANAVDDLAQAAGMELSPEMRAALSGNEHTKQMATSLRESATGSGRKYQESLDALHRDASDQALSGLGKTAEDVGRVAELSEHEEGLAAKASLEQEIKNAHGPLAEKFGTINDKYAKTELQSHSVDAIAERIGKIVLEDGHALRSDSVATKELNSIVKDLPNIKTLEDLRRFQSTVREDLTSKQLFGLNRKIIGVLRDVEESTVSDVLGKEAPELLAVHKEARQGYRELSDKLEALNDRLHVGKYHGPGGFLRNLKEMAPEAVMQRLKATGDADLQNLLLKEFPGTAQAVKDFHINQILKKAVNAPRALEGGVDTRVLFKQLDSLSPELRDFLLSPSQQGVLKGVQGVVEKLPERGNPSGTAKTLDSLLSFPGGVGAIVSGLLTGNPLSGFLIGHVGRQLSRDVPDAIKLALLKFMGSEGPIEAGAFRSMVDVAEKAYKSAKSTSRAVEGVTRAGANTLVTPPTSAKVIRLDDYLKAAQHNQDPLTQDAGDMGTYLPEHAVAVGIVTGKAVEYLNSLRPSDARPAPLDPPREPNDIEKAQFNRALEIAESPLLVMQHIKDGSLTPSDMKTLIVLYPKLYESYKEQLMGSVIKAQEKGNEIPYKTSMALSLFMGQPMDSSLMPNNIQANQASNVPPQPPMPPGKHKSPPQSGLKNLSTLSQAAATPQQARDLNHTTRK